MEKDIQKNIFDYLRFKKVFCFKINNVGIFKKSTGKYIPVGMKGLPDIMAFKEGQAYGIEVKAKTSQSEYQKEFQVKFEKAGGTYILAFGLDDVMRFL